MSGIRPLSAPSGIDTKGVGDASMKGPEGASLVGFIHPGTTPISRTLASKSHDVVSVFDFMTPEQQADVLSGAMTINHQPFIQAAIDYAIYGIVQNGLGLGKIIINDGVWRIDDTIHIGYGDTYRSCILEGSNYRYAGVTGFCGVAIHTTFADRPAIAIQGGRGSGVRGLGLYGLLYTWINNQGLAAFSPLIDDTNPANWIDPALLAENPHMDSRYAPYAGVAIDPYAGTVPSAAYPHVTYPSFLGSLSQYGKSHSSDCFLENMEIRGFVVGVVNQPCNADGNGDYTNLRRLNMSFCKWGVSICNTQSRAISIDNVKQSIMYCFLTNNVHGVQNGVLNGTINNLSGGASIMLHQFGSSSAFGPLKFLHCQMEFLWMIGTYTGSTSAETALSYDHCKFGFDAQNSPVTRGVPACILNNLGSGYGMYVNFEGTDIVNFPTVAGIFEGPNISFRGTSIFPEAPISKPYQLIAQNAMCGGLALKQLGASANSTNTIKWSSPPGGNASIMRDGLVFGNRSTPLPLYAVYSCPLGIPWGERSVIPNRIAIYSKSSLISVSLSGTTLKLVFPSLTAYQALSTGLTPGDVIWDDKTGTVFWIRSTLGKTVLAEIQNNYHVVGGSVVPITAFSTTSGNLYFGASRVFTPNNPLYGNTSTSSAVISNAQRGDGYALWMNAEINAGDYLLTDPYRLNYWSPSYTTVVSRDDTVPSITLSGNAAQTLTGVHFTFWIAAPPANM